MAPWASGSNRTQCSGQAVMSKVSTTEISQSDKSIATTQTHGYV